MSLRLILAVICTSFLVSTVCAQDDQTKDLGLSTSGKKAFDFLMTAKTFEDAHVGYGGELSKSVEAYRQILKEPKRAATFKLLLEKGSKVGQLYALAGLFDEDHALFLTEIKRFKTDSSIVSTLSGCIGGGQRVQTIVFLDRPNTLRLKDQYESYESWARRAKNLDGYNIDISGGGYSRMFRGQDLIRPN